MGIFRPYANIEERFCSRESTKSFDVVFIGMSSERAFAKLAGSDILYNPRRSYGGLSRDIEGGFRSSGHRIT